MLVQTTREDHRVAALAALAIAIHVLESAVPTPVPGVKPGLANVVTVVTIVLYGWRAAAWVSLLRVVAGSLVIGTFLSPTFMLSLTGASFSLMTMGLGFFVARSSLSSLGYSVLGSMGHMLGQVCAAYLLFIPHPAVLQLLPVLLSFALLFGVVSGRIALALVRRMPAAVP